MIVVMGRGGMGWGGGLEEGAGVTVVMMDKLCFIQDAGKRKSMFCCCCVFFVFVLLLCLTLSSKCPVCIDI